MPKQVSRRDFIYPCGDLPEDFERAHHAVVSLHTAALLATLNPSDDSERQADAILAVFDAFAVNPRRLLARVIQELVAASEPDTRFGATCAHEAVIAFGYAIAGAASHAVQIAAAREGRLGSPPRMYARPPRDALIEYAPQVAESLVECLARHPRCRDHLRGCQLEVMMAAAARTAREAVATPSGRRPRAQKKTKTAPKVPEQFRIAATLWPKYVREMKGVRKKATHEGFRTWALKHHKCLIPEAFAPFWSNHQRIVRRVKTGK